MGVLSRWLSHKKAPQTAIIFKRSTVQGHGTGTHPAAQQEPGVLDAAAAAEQASLRSSSSSSQQPASSQQCCTSVVVSCCKSGTTAMHRDARHQH
jgi:hypothetical protein